MSNPGVLTLTEKKLGGKKPFRVEDNLGESIHLHYRDMRVDLTVKELLYLGEEADKVLVDRVTAKGFDPDLFEGDALVELSSSLLDLIEMRKETVPLSSLRAYGKNALGLPVWLPLAKVAPGKATESKTQIILFNDQPMIRYGQEAAVCAFRQDPAGSVSILRLIFRDGLYAADEIPWKAKLIRAVKRLFGRK